MIVYIRNNAVPVDKVITASVKYIVNPASLTLSRLMPNRGSLSRLETTYYLDNGMEGTLIYRDPLILRIKGDKVLVKEK